MIFFLYLWVFKYLRLSEFFNFRILENDLFRITYSSVLSFSKLTIIDIPYVSGFCCWQLVVRFCLLYFLENVTLVTVQAQRVIDYKFGYGRKRSRYVSYITFRIKFLMKFLSQDVYINEIFKLLPDDCNCKKSNIC